MNIQVVMKAAILTSGFLFLTFCRDLFAMALIGAEYLYVHIDRMPDIVVFDLAMRSFLLAVVALALTGAVMAAGIVLWGRVVRM